MDGAVLLRPTKVADGCGYSFVIPMRILEFEFVSEHALNAKETCN